MPKEHAGSLLKTTRTIQGMTIGEKKDFGVGCHMAPPNPSFTILLTSMSKETVPCQLMKMGSVCWPMLSTQSVRVKNKVLKPLP